MTRICQRNWSKPGVPDWRWCILLRGHEGPCCGASGPKREDELYFEDQPEAAAVIEAKRVRQARIDAKKADK